MDLFTPVVGEEAQHPYFRSIWKQADRFNCDVLNENACQCLAGMGSRPSRRNPM
jgi:hypothetical protein